VLDVLEGVRRVGGFKTCSTCWRVLDMVEDARRVLLCVPEAVEGELCC